MKTNSEVHVATAIKSICDYFQKTVENYSELPCIEYGNHVYTYKEVNERANQLAHYLRKNGAQPESLIGIFQERSPEMIISILAVLKSGAAYVPISTTYPSERIAYIMNETNFNMILTSSLFEKNLLDIQSDEPVKLVALDKEWSQVEKESNKNLSYTNAPSDLAYIIYTSGSTGTPKGVMIEHRGIPNLVIEQIEKFKLTSSDRALQFASAAFDASVSEIFTTLVAGATLVLMPQEGLYVGEELYHVLKDHKITVATLTPSVLNSLPQKELPALKTLISAGEACTKKLIQYWSPKLNFINAYGPTETTVCATLKVCDPSDVSVSLGSPIANTAVYILTDQLKPVNYGEIGELYISSIGLARGYLNAPSLTQGSFIQNPFQDGISDRLYKTGDLCLHVSKDHMEWMGREDLQVKVSGIRIELGELEYVLREYSDVQEAVVKVLEDEFHNKQIAAYITTTSTTKPSIQQIKSYLQGKVPNYMIPSKYMFLDEFPVLTSGKIDRNRLPYIEDIRPDIDVKYVEPRNPLEETLSQIWRDVLRIDKVGIYDNFFDLGGQSLMATQMVSRIRSILGMNIPLHIIFNAIPTVEQTAQAIEQYQLEQYDPAELEKLLSELELIDEDEVNSLVSTQEFKAMGAPE